MKLSINTTKLTGLLSGIPSFILLIFVQHLREWTFPSFHSYILKYRIVAFMEWTFSFQGSQLDQNKIPKTGPATLGLVEKSTFEKMTLEENVTLWVSRMIFQIVICAIFETRTAGYWQTIRDVIRQKYLFCVKQRKTEDDCKVRQASSRSYYWPYWQMQGRSTFGGASTEGAFDWSYSGIRKCARVLLQFSSTVIFQPFKLYIDQNIFINIAKQWKPKQVNWRVFLNLFLLRNMVNRTRPLKLY